MTLHTAGPWFNTSQNDTPTGEVMDQPLDSGVTMHISVSGPNAKADACLIAAAPDLLDVLQAIVTDLEDGDEFSALQIARSAGRAAIAKAGGEA